jgi:hypothetical protein
MSQFSVKCTSKTITAASGVIFADPVTAKNCAPGAIQFSYVPMQPQLTNAGEEPVLLDESNIQDEHPVFNSTRFGDATYAQLSLQCPRRIRRGAVDGSEMGAFHYLYQPQREDNLLAILNDYLPAGMEARIYYVT